MSRKTIPLILAIYNNEKYEDIPFYNIVSRFILIGMFLARPAI